jgi:putative modified peptide
MPGKTTPAQLDSLLDRLSTDDAFREKMLGDPVAALAEHGIAVDPASVPTARQLPSKDALVRDRATIRSQVADTAKLDFFFQLAK